MTVIVIAIAHSRRTMSNDYYVYILTNDRNTVLYTGVTNDLERRLHEHKESKLGFTSRYNCHKLVWFETGCEAEQAITREKQIKAGSRARKIALIESANPKWKDLSKDWA